MTAADFLLKDDASQAHSLVQAWQNVIEQPMMQQLDQEVVLHSRAQVQQVGGQMDAAAFLEQGSQKPFLIEGKPASDFEPKSWPAQPITPDPYRHLTHRQGGGTNEHNNIEGAMGVQSASIPWDYRHYSGNLNSHRKAEPLIYTPLAIAKDHDGKSAIDLTSLVNRKYQTERMSSNPQYANTLSALTDYRPVQLHPTDHWLPQIPVQNAPGVRNQKLWEKHFLDLYAPTPPPLLAPVPPRMPKPFGAQPKPSSLLETHAAPLPSILTHGERVKPLITPVLDANQQPVTFHNPEVEAEELMHQREVDIFAPAHPSNVEFVEEDVQVTPFEELSPELQAEELLEDAEHEEELQELQLVW